MHEARAMTQRGTIRRRIFIVPLLLESMLASTVAPHGVSFNHGAVG
jgi:hypothetical protein